jgi:PTH1 family peptidyl-tRNA hydrolase
VALVFALGNPGERYARTRHNVGWWVADELRRRHRATPLEAVREYRAWRATVEEREIDIVLPLLFMNASGDALAAWRDRHGMELDALLVVSDDVYLPVGHIRLRPNGSSGGHRGLESIEEALGSREYSRLRIGVGAVESEQLREHVLETFEGDEERVMEDAVRTAADAVELWARDGILAAMNRFNRRATKEASES